MISVASSGVRVRLLTFFHFLSLPLPLPFPFLDGESWTRYHELGHSTVHVTLTVSSSWALETSFASAAVRETPFASGLCASGVPAAGTLPFTLGIGWDEFVRDVGTGAGGALRVTTMAVRQRCACAFCSSKMSSATINRWWGFVSKVVCVCPSQRQHHFATDVHQARVRSTCWVDPALAFSPKRSWDGSLDVPANAHLAGSGHGFASPACDLCSPKGSRKPWKRP